MQKIVRLTLQCLPLLMLTILSCNRHSTAIDAIGRIQHITERADGEDWKAVGFTRYAADGRRLEAQYYNTHQRFEYDQHDSLVVVRAIDAQGTESVDETRRYDDRGNLLEDIFYAGNEVAIMTVRYQYDPQGRCLHRVTDNKYGGKTDQTFAHDGQLCTVQTRAESNGDLVTIHYTYDPNGMLLREEFDDQDMPMRRYSQHYQYDAAGRITSIEEHIGPEQEISYQRFRVYDPQGRLIKTYCTPEDGQGCIGKIEYDYNSTGDLISEREYAADRLLLERQYRWEDDVTEAKPK